MEIKKAVPNSPDKHIPLPLYVHEKIKHVREGEWWQEEAQREKTDGQKGVNGGHGEERLGGEVNVPEELRVEQLCVCVCVCVCVSARVEALEASSVCVCQRE